MIKPNPDQSKHLETATTRVMGTWVDFVNLRQETYADTRIPEMSIGTPLQDAERRDLTINALFYNINTRSIEDLTGSGLNDLARGVIRTPLDPLVTLKDDPLRALRAVRFSTRFGFTIHDGLMRALSTTDVHVRTPSPLLQIVRIHTPRQPSRHHTPNTPQCPTPAACTVH